MDVENRALGQVLRCGRCNKPFDKQSSLTRHGYYCRSRRVGNTSRSRSCLGCVKAKTGCDNQRPACSRCTAKRITCQYPERSARGVRQPEPLGGDLSPYTSSSPSTTLGFLSDTAVGSGLPSPGGIEEAIFQEALDMPTLAIQDFSFPSLGTDNAGNFGGGVDFDFDYLVTQTDLPLPTSIPPTPSSAVRSLVRRPNLPSGAQRTSNLIFHILKSYPFTMMRHGGLPPFIHPSLVAPSVEDVHMEPVTNCISLVHMLSCGVQSTRKLFWKNVRLECEHLIEDVYKLSRWELLAGLQAISIYILIRLREGETDYNNLDSLLMRAMATMAQQISRDIACSQHCSLCNDGLDTSWKDWAYRESRRRLGVVYRAVNMLVYFEPATMCPMPRDVILGPLPSRKQLWEARDEFAWRAEGLKEPGDLQSAYALAENGDIVKLAEGRLSCNDAWLSYRPNNRTTTTKTNRDTTTNNNNSSYWEEWSAGMDELGGLVTLAASLVV